MDLANWDPKQPKSVEIPFKPARVLAQDFTGVPLLVDLAAMRSVVEELGGDPQIIEPLVPCRSGHRSFRSGRRLWNGECAAD